MAAAPVELSRREREAVEAQRKKDHYMKLHAEGKTQEAQVCVAACAAMDVAACLPVPVPGPCRGRMYLLGVVWYGIGRVQASDK